MIKKTNEMPLFDERFINYGYNKIEWIETLRYTGYKFAVLINGFGMDVPHPQYVRFDSFYFFLDLNSKRPLLVLKLQKEICINFHEYFFNHM